VPAETAATVEQGTKVVTVATNTVVLTVAMVLAPGAAGLGGGTDVGQPPLQLVMVTVDVVEVVTVRVLELETMVEVTGHTVVVVMVVYVAVTVPGGAVPTGLGMPPGGVVPILPVGEPLGMVPGAGDPTLPVPLAALNPAKAEPASAAAAKKMEVRMLIGVNNKSQAELQGT